MTTRTEHNRTAFPIGSKVKVAERFADQTGPGLYPVAGVVYEVTGCRDTESGFQIRINDGNTEYGSDWFVYAEAVGPDYIPFTLTKETSKEYAARSNSRNLDEDQRRVLDKAAKGQEVDAVAFRKAVTAALSLAATRAGQSRARRDYTRMARHLLYIVDAVIDNALQGLPPVDAGTRSPKIAEQQREIEDLRVTVQWLAEEVERARCSEKIEVERTAALLREKTDLDLRVGRLARGNARKTAQMDYALSLMAEPEKFKVIGYGDALNSIEA